MKRNVKVKNISRCRNISALFTLSSFIFQIALYIRTSANEIVARITMISIKVVTCRIMLYVSYDLSF